MNPNQNFAGIQSGTLGQIPWQNYAHIVDTVPAYFLDGFFTAIGTALKGYTGQALAQNVLESATVGLNLISTTVSAGSQTQNLRMAGGV